MTGLAGTTVVVTGGTRGIGLTICRHLVAEGATVAVTGRRKSDARRAADSIAGTEPGRTLSLPCDVRSETSVAALAKAVFERLGRVDVLVNNAGVATLRRFIDLSAKEWDDVFSVNARGTFLCSRVFARRMLEQGTGSIVNISSQAGHQGQPLVAHYCASKGAILALTKAMALELAPHVRVNAVCPGIVETEMIAQDFQAQARLLKVAEAEVRQRSLARIPLGRFQDASSIAAVVAFLASDDAHDITGQAFHVNGGMTTC